MEFKFSINCLFEDEVTMVDKSMTPFKNSQNVRNQHTSQIQEVIDSMGVASCKAQGLHGPITSASKLAYSDHHVYVMKDADANSGQGAIVGILKVGHKKLFVFDEHGNQREMDPLCVLDFYVHESRQRHGCGKRLFEGMLKKENIKPAHLAIDRPSHKFTSFLQKHYKLRATIPQVNNFVVFDGFYRDRPDQGKRSTKPPIHAYRNPNVDRYAAGLQSRPTSGHMTNLGVDPGRPLREVRSTSDMDRLRAASANLLAWDDNEPIEAFSNVKPSSGISRGKPEASVLPSGALLAQQNMYSRHSPSSDSSNHGIKAPTNLDLPPETMRGSGLTRDKSPPLLSRNGPSEDFRRVNSSYLDRQGRLRVDSATRSDNALPKVNSPSKTSISPPKQLSPSTTQAPPTMYSRKYGHTRLW